VKSRVSALNLKTAHLLLNHLVVIYNAVPDRSSLAADLKSEMGVMEAASGVVAALVESYRVSSLPFTGDIILLMEQLEDLKPDAVFNLFEGTYRLSKSEVLIPLMLDLLHIPFTGSPAKTLEMCVHKVRTKEILLRRSVPTPRFQVFQPNGKIETMIAFPLMVKPEHEDASIGISNESVVSTFDQLEKQVKMIWAAHRQGALCEEFIDGREFNVAILGDSRYENDFAHPLAPKVLPISEISFSGMPEGYQRIVSYKAKWDEESIEFKETKPICPPEIDLKLELRLKQIALRVFNALGCRDYARIDFRVNDDGEPFVVDINPNPDISKDAGLARAARIGGLDYNQLIRKIAEFALNRRSQID
jgi:D-alanine-D-alanine ligase